MPAIAMSRVFSCHCKRCISALTRLSAMPFIRHAPIIVCSRRRVAESKIFPSRLSNIPLVSSFFGAHGSGVNCGVLLVAFSVVSFDCFLRHKR